MKRFSEAIVKMMQGLSKAVLRFPWTVFCLLCTTSLTCYMISLHKTPELIIQKLMFTFMLGAFLGITAQFACERFQRLASMRLAVYGLSALLTLGYYLIISPAPAIDYGVGARTSVAIFSMFSAFIWLPSFRGKFDFNSVALVHFKSFFTSILYAAVLSGGLAAIIGAVDILLFKVNSDSYGYMFAIVWILFATIYYLSLLPRFNSETEGDQAAAAEAGHYPRFLEILVSYIAVPLVAAYTLVLLAYFIKIGITMKWPSGQLGPMILAYSASGLDHLCPGQPTGEPFGRPLSAHLPQSADPGGNYAACFGVYPLAGLRCYRVPLLRGLVWSLLHRVWSPALLQAGNEERYHRPTGSGFRYNFHHTAG